MELVGDDKITAENEVIDRLDWMSRELDVILRMMR